MSLPPSVLAELSRAVREGRSASAQGANVRVERGMSQAAATDLIERMRGPSEGRVSSVNDPGSFVTPTVKYEPTDQTVGLWHFEDGSGNSAEDSSANGNDLSLTDPTWTTGKFSGGISFNGSSTVGSVTLESAEPVSRYLYFAAWCNPTSGPIMQWEDVLEVYISGGNLCAQVESSTYTGPAVGSGWQLFHVQFFDGQVFIGVDDVVFSFTHGDNTLTVSAWDLLIGKRDSSYYSGTMDEVLLLADVTVEEDWGHRFYMAPPTSILYCTFDKGYGSVEGHQDFFGPTVNLSDIDWVTGWLGNAISLDGATAYADFTPAARTADELSIEFVLKFDGTGACTLIDQTSGINLSFTGTHIRAALQGVTNPASDIAAFVPTADTWYNLALVYDGSYKAIWINGNKIGQIAATGTVSVPASMVYVGRTVAGASYFGGDVDFLHVSTIQLRPQFRPRHRFIAGKHSLERNQDWVLLD